MSKFTRFFSKKNQKTQNKTRHEQKPAVADDSVSAEEPDDGHARDDRSRLVKTSVGWFARTREKDDLGPYSTEVDAQDALFAYLSLTKSNQERPYSPQVTHGMFIHDPETCTKDLCAFCIEAEAPHENIWSNLQED